MIFPGGRKRAGGLKFIRLLGTQPKARSSKEKRTDFLSDQESFYRSNKEQGSRNAPLEGAGRFTDIYTQGEKRREERFFGKRRQAFPEVFVSSFESQEPRFKIHFLALSSPEAQRFTQGTPRDKENDQAERDISITQLNVLLRLYR